MPYCCSICCIAVPSAALLFHLLHCCSMCCIAVPCAALLFHLLHCCSICCITVPSAALMDVRRTGNNSSQSHSLPDSELRSQRYGDRRPSRCAWMHHCIYMVLEKTETPQLDGPICRNGRADGYGGEGGERRKRRCLVLNDDYWILVDNGYTWFNLRKVKIRINVFFSNFCFSYATNEMW